MSSGISFTDFLIAVTPLVIVGVMAWYIMSRYGQITAQHAAQLQRQSEALERIAAALEKRQ